MRRKGRLVCLGYLAAGPQPNCLNTGKGNVQSAFLLQVPSIALLGPIIVSFFPAALRFFVCHTLACCFCVTSIPCQILDHNRHFMFTPAAEMASVESILATCFFGLDLFLNLCQLLFINRTTDSRKPFYIWLLRLILGTATGAVPLGMLWQEHRIHREHTLQEVRRATLVINGTLWWNTVTEVRSRHIILRHQSHKVNLGTILLLLRLSSFLKISMDSGLILYLELRVACRQLDTLPHPPRRVVPEAPGCCRTRHSQAIASSAMAYVYI